MKRPASILLVILLISVIIAPAQGRGRISGAPIGIAMSVAVSASQGNLDNRVAELSQQIAREMTDNQKRTIAVVEFADLNGRVTDFGRFLAEELITRLYQTKKFKVIERQLLNKVIGEQKLTLTGVIDQSSAQKLGRLLGVDAIASGTVTNLGRSLKVNARLIDTTTAEVFAVASAEIMRDESVSRLMGDEGSPAKSEEKIGSQASQQKSKTGQKFDAQFFTFDLQRCRLSGTTVACDFIITNNDRDRRLGINERTTMFDDAGNQYRSGEKQIANDEGYNPTAFLISGVPTRARVSFEQVSPQAIRITLLQIVLWADGAERFQIQYRNISLKEQGANEETDETKAGSVTTASSYSQERTVTVYGNQQWTDTGIDVSPGMNLEVIASGEVITGQNTAANEIISSVFKRRTSTRVPPRSVGPSALLAKIHYTNGGESKTLRVGYKNKLIVEQGEYGRLLFGIDDRAVGDNSGHFTVKMRW